MLYGLSLIGVISLKNDVEIDQALLFPFFSSLFKVGIAELKVAVEKTGGLVVLAESFGHLVFKDSLKHVFQLGDNDLGLASK